MSWSYVMLVSFLFGSVIGQFGYGAGVLLILAAATLWAGDALHLWINTGGAFFLITTFSITGLIAIATHLAILLYRKYIRPRPTD